MMGNIRGKKHNFTRAPVIHRALSLTIVCSVLTLKAKWSLSCLLTPTPETAFKPYINLMAYLLRRAGSQNTWPCKAARDIDFMLLFCYPKLYEGRCCGQKGIVLAYRRRCISICHRLEPLYLARNRLPVKRGNDDSKQKPPTHPRYRSRSAT